MAFDPDAYLAGGTAATDEFDPDAYLKKDSGGFDPDAYLANVPEYEPQVVTPPEELTPYQERKQAQIAESARVYKEVVQPGIRKAVETGVSYGPPIFLARKFLDKDNPVRQVAEGLIESGGALSQNLSQPENVALLAVTGGLGAGTKTLQVGQKVLSGYFAAQMARQMPEQWQAFKDAPDLKSKTAIAAEMAATAGFAYAGAKGALKRYAPEKVTSPTETPQDYWYNREGELVPAEAPEAIGERAPQKVGMFRTPQVILNKVFGGGLGDKVRQAEDIATGLEGERSADLRQLGLHKLSETEDTNLKMVLSGAEKPINDKVTKLSEYLTNIFKEDASDYVARGAQIRESPTIRDPDSGSVVRLANYRDFVPRENYFPQMVDPNKIVSHDVSDLTKFIEENNNMSKSDAADVVTYLRARAMGKGITNISNPVVEQLVKGSMFQPTHLHARSNLVLPDSVYRPLKESVPQYVRDSARERGFLQAVGRDADLQVDNAVTSGGRNATALGEEVYDAFRGRLLRPESTRRIKSSAQILNNLATTMLLGPQTAISQVSQFGNIAGKFGPVRLARGLAKVMFQGGRLEAERAGSYVNSLLNELSLTSRLTPSMSKLDKLSVATSRLASGVVRYSGIEAMDKFPRAVGYHAARIALQDAQRAAAFGNRKALRALKEVGIDPTATPEEISRGAAELSRKYNVMGNWSDLPYVMQTPIGSFARGLNTFNVQVSRLMWNNFVKPAMKGDVAPLIRLIASNMLVGEAVGDTRRWLSGRTSDRPGGSLPEFLDDVIHGRAAKKDLAKRALDDLSWSGSLGYVQNMVQPIQFAQSAPEAAARVGSTLTGAGVSSALETGGGLAQTLISGAQLMAASKDPEGEADRNKILNDLSTGGRILTRRIPIVGGLIGPRAFTSEKADRRVATEGVQRALRRGNSAQAAEWNDWFAARHQGKQLPEKAFDVTE